MKIIESPDREKAKFVGTRHECSQCATVFEVESEGDVQRIHQNALGWKLWASVECPNCHNIVMITTFWRFLGDVHTCKPVQDGGG